ncbi:60S acidic ribosomal protein P2-like [Limulus polyphemus]|uniref:Large ribosomal subunit protein P2 n=1 Tax=Limulus polyphemus TaxID=6850 RepID=A0ABM1BPY2_LIMPO|nr:60S acidic ribosomal protein P2-like [Limulus polyphemus]XP_013786401.1 60S acidic ribosomal protein P2-like [Limulus polyphemus]XP_013786402.1 60S acidic ribosomal protein P2-like [Limulus polyphemus]
MRYVAAYLLSVLGGNKNPSSEDIEKILGSVGIEAEKQKLDKVIKELKGKDVNEVMEEGRSKLASVPLGGGVTAVVGVAADTKETTEAVKVETKEEAKKEESESSDEDMGFGLFD